MFIPFLSSLIACGAGPTDTTAADAALHACEHAGESEGTLPESETTGNAVVLPMDGEPYTAILADSVASYLAVQIEAPTLAILFVGTADVAFDLFNGEESVGLPPAAPVESCPEDIPEHFEIDFDTIGTWYIQLGPTTVSDAVVSLAAAEAS
ncbi:MAG: hypothetical protein Q8P18_10710 [Pseudomonadota bacterium]|nr:hypothetical protein [Pseudomonadota bacterium]